jgi:glycosyltransferase involved in cell wall biosynthesis
MALQSAHALQKQGHTVTLYTFERSDDCFPDLQKWLDIRVWETGKNIPLSPLRKLVKLVTLARELRHVDIIIANNPPMQIVAAIAKVFSRRIHTIWWHHHIPWYFTDRLHGKKISISLFWKGLFEKMFVVPCIDQMISTSHFIAEKVQNYCGRESKVIHPIIEMREYGVLHKQNSEHITIFTHGRLEAGKGLDIIVRVFERMKNSGRKINLIIFWTGSLASKLKEQGIDVRTFDREKTFFELSSGQYGHVLGVYCSEIDGFGMAPLECQMTGISTVILDRAGARETIVTDVSGEPVWYLVDSEDSLFATVSYYLEHKMFPEQLSIVNFSHQKSYYLPERLSRDLLSVISKIGV